MFFCQNQLVSLVKSLYSISLQTRSGHHYLLINIMVFFLFFIWYAINYSHCNFSSLTYRIINSYLFGEYAPKGFKKSVKPALEILAAVPTVVYGFFALIVVTPFLQSIFPGLATFNAASAGIVMGIMIIPMISSLSEDALSSIPKSLREASYGMGSTPFQTAFKVLCSSSILWNSCFHHLSHFKSYRRNYDCCYCCRSTTTIDL